MAKTDEIIPKPVYIVTAIFLDEEAAQAAADLITGTVQRGTLRLDIQ